MFYSKEEIKKIMAIPIWPTAVALGLRGKKRTCHCPKHADENPSLHIYESSNRFFCFSCGKGGGVIDLVMFVLNVDFIEACNWLASFSRQPVSYVSCMSHPEQGRDDFDAARYARYFANPVLNEPARHFLFAQRRLSPVVVESCRLSSWRNWLQIPFLDIDGHLIGVQWRNLGTVGPRFRFPVGSQCHIYNLPILKTVNPGEQLYISEGCSDSFSLLSSGHKAIAIPSASLLNSQTIKELSDINSRLSIDWHMYPDNDAPGEALFRQLCTYLTVTRHTLPADCKDYSDYYLQTLDNKL